MEEPDTQIVPVIEEELVTDTRIVKTGSVRVRKEVHQVHKTVEMAGVQDVVSVTRVPVNRPVSAASPIREKGDTLIISVVEEELVVQKRLILKEEIHIRRQRTKVPVKKTVTLDRERAIVERLNAAGEVIHPPASSQTRR